MGSFAYVVAEWGQYQYIVRELARAPERAGALLAGAIALRVGAATVLAGATGLLAAILGYPLRTSELAGAMVVALLPFFLAQAHNLVFRARERMEFEAIATVVDKGLTLGFALLFLKLGFGLAGVLLAMGTGGLGSLLAAVLLAGHLAVHPDVPRWRTVLELLRGGASMALLNAETSAQNYVDPVVLSKLAPDRTLGWFGAARSISGTLIAPAIVLEISSYPRLSRTVDDPPRFRLELRAVMRGTITLAALAMTGTLLFAKPAVELVFGDKGFAESGILLQWTAPVLFLFYVDNILAAAVIAARRSTTLVFAKLANLGASVILAFFTVPYFEAHHGNGALGMVVAGGLSELVVLATALRVLLPRGALDPRLLFDLGRALAAAAGTLVLFKLLPHLALAPGMVACIGAYAVLGLTLRLVTIAELRALVPGLRSEAGP
jgi:O-antigen/teichoic acid export membrane protein